jgi:hypothetical protein
MSTLAKQSFAALLAQFARRPESFDRVGDVIKGPWIQRVVHPAAFTPINQDSGIFENLQMERQAGLTSLKAFCEITDAFFSAAQTFDDLESCLIRERMKEARGLRSICRGRAKHRRDDTSTFLDMSSALLHTGVWLGGWDAGVQKPQPLIRQQARDVGEVGRDESRPLSGASPIFF